MNYLNGKYAKYIVFLNILKNNKGQGLVEYALILVLLVAIVIAGISMLKGKPDPLFSKVVDSLSNPR